MVVELHILQRNLLVYSKKKKTEWAVTHVSTATQDIIVSVFHRITYVLTFQYSIVLIIY